MGRGWGPGDAPGRAGGVHPRLTRSFPPPPAGIWSAARDGDERRVLELLERRGEPGQPDLAGYTALVTGDGGCRSGAGWGGA